MTFPTIHDNGTSRQMLAASYEAAYDALQTAYDLLKQTGPNPRDYPALGFETAIAEHMARLYRVREVMEELDALIGHCDGEGGLR